MKILLSLFSGDNGTSKHKNKLMHIEYFQLISTHQNIITWRLIARNPFKL
jgi:hypothetical protein